MEEISSVRKLMKKNVRRNYSIHPQNIIFYDYFNNLKRKALAQGHNNLVISFKKILSSILKYPLPIKNCLDAYKLKGVGKRFSYFFEKALKQTQNENNYNYNDDNYVSNVRNFNINNHISKVIKCSNDFLREFDELNMIKKIDDITEDDNILRNLKEIENDHINKEKKNSKYKIKNDGIHNSPLHFNGNNDSLCLTIQDDKHGFSDSLNKTIISDNRNDKNKMSIEYKEESLRKSFSPNKLEKTISNYENSSMKKNKKIELTDLEKNILNVIGKYNHLYNENAMSKEEINILFLKNYKKLVNINFRSLNKLIKSGLLEKIKCIENKYLNNDVSKNKMKLKTINKIKLTERGKKFFDEEKEKLLKEASITKCEDNEFFIKLNNVEEKFLHTNITELKENVKDRKNETKIINHSEEILKEKIIQCDTKYNYDHENNKQVKENNTNYISLVDYGNDKHKINSLEEKESSSNSNSNTEKKLNNDVKENLENNDIFSKEDRNNYFVYNYSNLFLDVNDKIEENCQYFKNEKFTDNNNVLMMLDTKENYTNDMNKLCIKKKEEKTQITKSKNNVQNKENIDVIEKSDSIREDNLFEPIKEFNLIGEKKESSYFEIKMENKKREIKKKLKLSLKEKLEQKKSIESMSNNNSSLLTCNLSKNNYSVNCSKVDVNNNEKNTKPCDLIWDKDSIINRNSEIKEYKEDSSKIISSDINNKTNNLILDNNYINFINGNEEKISKNKIRDLKEINIEVNIPSDDNQEKLSYKNINEENYNSSESIYCDMYKKECGLNTDSYKCLKKKEINNLENNYEKVELISTINKENIDNQDKCIIENIQEFERKNNNYDIINISELSSDKQSHSSYMNNYMRNSKTENKRNNNILNKKSEMENKNDVNKKKVENKRIKKKRKRDENQIRIDIENENNEITYGPYEIIMVIDNRDISGANCEYNEKMKKIFKDNNINFITRNLPLGDTIWLCRRAIYSSNMNSSKNNKTGKKRKKKEKERNEENYVNILNENNNLENNNEEKNIKYEEYVLKWIIERKTLNDLSASIIDGRYEEQKYRLMRSKEMYHIIYLIENCNNSYKNYMNSSKISYETLTNAQYSTQLVSGFSILNSQSMNHTLFLLSEIHFQIVKNIKRFCEIKENEEMFINDKLLMYLKNNSCSWEKWNNESKKSKNNIVKEVFGKQLRLINMCGPDATELILSLWSTPFKLNQALHKYTHDGILAEKLKRIYIKNYEIKGKKKIKSPIDTQLIAQLRQLYAPDSI
ncbi:crossover junction endonuclease MUS81, putative [Plasmodium gallinaceum]|uniref:Crossover junction endonuclease MUS81 n=1 Tax=Plasmodium gallinaceum TaxID=5849 RepID=A0A1J1GUG5_PLAGA|nr:crossover junction endonuclease MUS81, putative [Plasmodium gallinaceum]CRG94689.1 crossover junction endonuclease MUS81, putative [Plasmodium gallinaceum]